MQKTISIEQLSRIAALMRYYILAMTTQAGSGHPTSSLSAADLMAGLLFGGIFKYNVNNPGHPNNDRLIFSKGHASPLYYSMWAAAGILTEADLMTYRKFGSVLEGHPAVSFPYVEAATGSLGQGLSIGLGMALNARYLDKLPYRTWVLLGDSEMAEGSQWEALQLAVHYRLGNLIGILDVNRLGQRGETMYGHDTGAYARRVAVFGWEVAEIDGHSFNDILLAYEKALRATDKPMMIIAKTIKGKGVSFIEDRDGWHGKALSREQFDKAVKELPPVDKTVRGEIAQPADLHPARPLPEKPAGLAYPAGAMVPTRKAYGAALARLSPCFPRMVSLDGEVSNSTYAELFKERCPERFFEMYIAEQNMVGVALGLACRGAIPFVSTFAAFMTRAFDQIRMSRYSEGNIKFAGSHAGVSIGQDGPSQMGLEDIAMFRTILDSVVLYPADAMSTERLVEAAANHDGMVYIRTMREATPVIYQADEIFTIGGSKVLKKSAHDSAAVIGAGITLHEALAAHELLRQEGLMIRVIDAYSIKPLDERVLRDAAQDVPVIITVEDHVAQGGLGEAVRSALAGSAEPIHALAVMKKPMSGTPAELLDYEGISRKAIVEKVKELL